MEEVVDVKHTEDAVRLRQTKKHERNLRNFMILKGQ